MSAYLLKPIRQSELRGAIAMVLGSRPKDGTVALITRFSVRDARQLGIALAILVTEDYVVNQRLVARMLEKRGHKVFVVANGQEALDALAKDEYDLVFMDVQMPRDGWTDGNYDSQREGGWLAKTPSGHCLNCARLER